MHRLTSHVVRIIMIIVIDPSIYGHLANRDEAETVAGEKPTLPIRPHPRCTLPLYGLECISSDVNASSIAWKTVVAGAPTS